MSCPRCKSCGQPLPQKRNARFWIYANGDYVKLTLRPGKTLRFEYGGPDEEGYSYTRESYTYDASSMTVVSVIITEARDCDGRLDSHSMAACPLDKLAVRENEYCPDILFPEWEKVSSGQRDYAAEAMGY